LAWSLYQYMMFFAEKVTGNSLVILLLLGTLGSSVIAAPQEGYVLTPISGSDGVFETVDDKPVKIYRAVKRPAGGYALYLYFRVPDNLAKGKAPLYLEVTYKDTGRGLLAVEYNGTRSPYQRAEGSHGRELTDGGRLRTAVFLLANPSFRRAQNLQTDLRVSGPGPGVPYQIVDAKLFLEPTPLFTKLTAKPWLEPYQEQTHNDIDAKTIRGKVLCGYQGWFRCPGDGAEQGWVHWSRDSRRIAAETLTFDMWPDMTEYSDEERFPVPGFTFPSGGQAYLYSSIHPRTIDRHFEWMRKYGIDGVLVQRFAVGLSDPSEASRVLGHARSAANRTGRTFVVEYDLSGMKPDQLYDTLVRDWKWLVDEMKITQDARYLHHDGKPVLAIFGFFSDRFSALHAHRLLDFFKNDEKYRVYFIGGCQHSWRVERDPEWARAFRRFDAISPWNIGNTTRVGNKTYAMVSHWPKDVAEAKRVGMRFMPTIYPGFSWDNLMKTAPGKSLIPRLKGDFYWKQFAAAAALDVDAVFVAMFDEVDEGTAIFKVTNAPPRESYFATLEGMPTDWYLRLTGEGTRLIRKERKYTSSVPIKP
jgi:hypothetical protein